MRGLYRKNENYKIFTLILDQWDFDRLDKTIQSHIEKDMTLNTGLNVYDIVEISHSSFLGEYKEINHSVIVGVAFLSDKKPKTKI